MSPSLHNRYSRKSGGGIWKRRARTWGRASLGRRTIICSKGAHGAVKRLRTTRSTIDKTEQQKRRPKIVGRRFHDSQELSSNKCVNLNIELFSSASTAQTSVMSDGISSTFDYYVFCINSLWGGSTQEAIIQSANREHNNPWYKVGC